MLKRIFYIGSLVTFLYSCGPVAESEEASSASNPETDTAMATNTVPQPAEEPDSTLQPVVELKLRAIGNNLEEIAYSEDSLEVAAGSLVKLEFTNEGVDQPMIHNVVVTELGKYKEVALAGEKEGAPSMYLPDDSTNVLAASPLALPGQTVTMEFDAPLTPGTYDFVCTYPEHWKRMHGNLIVK
ncbi:plastocyanin/azurin family copper-binding protein [Pontibacter silvestris]|uniref:Plastocyanin/azurin family copper-binding protein n=1 Tax=Pontibacter silvestris TaxID=2305183 RepID=A0ABW4WYC9_9BACT|nr:plastocyanin/azurin family copper-binding protein [Pontibacter silvestris]MCC9137376.1 plastocyanin/azurin family copper-binding protein [Pontibacter silvestris]